MLRGSAAKWRFRASLFEVFDYVRDGGLIFGAFGVAVVEHSVIVENVTIHQLRNAVSIRREESDANDLGHGFHCRARNRDGP